MQLDPFDPSKDLVEYVARRLMRVAARPPGSAEGPEQFVLSADTDFDDLPRNGNEGTEDDEITQEAVLRLAEAALLAVAERVNACAANFTSFADRACAEYLKDAS